MKHNVGSRVINIEKKYVGSSWEKGEKPRRLKRYKLAYNHMHPVHMEENHFTYRIHI